MNNGGPSPTVAPLAGLPDGIRSQHVSNINGLDMHYLEAGFDQVTKGRLLLLHGFPELAYSWRKVMLPLAQAGFHVIAPDQRGYGRTTGWHGDYDGSLAPSKPLNLVQDALALVGALGWQGVDAVIGHDFGSSVAAWCALVRPDVFQSVVMMSAPFGGPPSLASKAANPWGDDLHKALACLPRPRKHYQWYYATRGADSNMRFARQGIHHFLRAYYHHKSADWRQNVPHKLAGIEAGELAKMPTYYLMDLAEGMAETVEHEMPSAQEIAACQWLPDAELAVYAAEFARTGFQGALNWYRASIDETLGSELKLFSGRQIEVPAMFLAGQSDWGIYQKPGAFEAMQLKACQQMKTCLLIPGAGHWVQQEQPKQVCDSLLSFLEK